MFDVLFKITLFCLDYNTGLRGIWLIDSKLPCCTYVPGKTDSYVQSFVSDNLGIEKGWFTVNQFRTLFDDNGIVIAYSGLFPNEVKPKKGIIDFSQDYSKLSKQDKSLIEEGFRWV